MKSWNYIYRKFHRTEEITQYGLRMLANFSLKKARKAGNIHISLDLFIFTYRYAWMCSLYIFGSNLKFSCSPSFQSVSLLTLDVPKIKHKIFKGQALPVVIPVLGNHYLAVWESILIMAYFFNCCLFCFIEQHCWIFFWDIIAFE